MTDPILAEWDNFYVIVGSAAAALTGLQFVVMALVAERHIRSSEATSSFATPTIVHFTTVLVIGALLAAPWHHVRWPLVCVAAGGVAGCIYLVRVVRASRRQREYRPELEDVIWHWCLPSAGYFLLAICWLFAGHPEEALFVVGGASLLLLCVGIHNAWDSAVYIAQGHGLERAGDEPSTLEDPGD